MEIKILATGSSGNCYIIEDRKNKMMIECGVPVRKIKKRCGYKLNEVSGCLISHAHLDHCRAVVEVANCGIPVYMLQSAKESLAVDHYNINTFGTGELLFKPEQFKIGCFNILAFPLLHKNADGSDCQNAGFLIQSGDEKLVYITDTPYSNYNIPGLTHIMIEANYSIEILDENIRKGVIPYAMWQRLLYSHMEIGSTKEFLLSNDLSKCQAIYLIHMSDNNADPCLFQRDVQEITGVPVFA